MASFRFIIFFSVAVALSSCSTVGFYTQALSGQVEISRKAKPISRVLADPATPPLLRNRLEAVQKIRAFASSDLHLPAEDQYDRYANLKRRYVNWVVFAAPEFSVEAHAWWYPILGRLKYRGFFKEQEARAEAERLRKQGLEVYVAGVEAYSTLGWFRDPILNTFAGRKDADLAELLFHELTHQRLYLSGDTDFNEAFATANGQEGARRWLRSQGRLADLAQYEKECRILREFISSILQTRGELNRLYTTTGVPPEQMRKEKKQIHTRLIQRIHRLNARYGGSLKVEKWLAEPITNPRLNTVATYYDLVPGFDALLKQANGDLETFYKRVESMKTWTPEKRKQHLMNLAKH